MDLTGRVKGVQWVITFGSGRAWKSPRSVSLGTDTRRSYPVRAGLGWRTPNTFRGKSRDSPVTGVPCAVRLWIAAQ